MALRSECPLFDVTNFHKCGGLNVEKLLNAQECTIPPGDKVCETQASLPSLPPSPHIAASLGLSILISFFLYRHSD